MRDSRNPARSWRPLALSAVLVAGGCAGTRSADLRFVSASAREDGGYYSVMALIENLTPAPVSLDMVSIEMTTFDGQGKVIAAGYPTTVVAREVGPGQKTRVPITCPDRERLVRGSKLFLKDAGGRVISELSVAPIAGTEGETPAAGADGDLMPRLELKVLGRPE